MAYVLSDCTHHSVAYFLPQQCPRSLAVLFHAGFACSIYLLPCIPKHTYTCLFSCPPIDRHMGCLQTFLTVNHISVKICVRLSLCMCAKDTHQQRALWDHRVCTWKIFIDIFCVWLLVILSFLSVTRWVCFELTEWTKWCSHMEQRERWLIPPEFPHPLDL